VAERLAAWTELVGDDQRPTLAGTVDEVADELREYERVGVSRVMAQHLLHEDVEMVAILGELASASS
jgi:alkanesulfonate monooxygenase SsuD/methylene tetrahydromethanopterin reductase-like flavin-dependent oxidoreductase (luciferase family)